MSTPRRLVVVGFVLGLVVSVLTVVPAAAAHVSCGQVITTSVTLDSDLFCPTGNGLVLQGTGLVLNLNGHTIRGQLDSRTVSQPNALGDNGVLGAPYVTRFARGQFAGIEVRGSRNVVIGPGTVKHFAAGVFINGMGGTGGYNTIRGLTVEENLGPPVSEFFGDGILILESFGNRVGLNTVRNNGAYDGIGLLGNARNNLIHDNVVVDNKIPEVCPDFDVFVFSVSGGGQQHLCGPTHPTRGPFTFVNQQNHGIKLEQGGNGTASHSNIIQNNRISGNGNTGIFLTTTCPDLGETGQTCFGEQHSDNVFRGNRVNGNGFGYPAGLPDRRMFEGPANGGGGMTIMLGGPKPAIRSLVTGNTFNDNARDGVAVLAHRVGTGVTSSQFTRNTALRNNASPVPGGFPAFNGHDGNVFINAQTPCDNNVWSDNNFGSTPADIHGPIPPNNLSSHPCVGPVLPPQNTPTQATAAEAGSSGPTYLSRFRPIARR